MNNEAIKKRMEYLAQEIDRHNFLYYVKNQPEISDSEYDALFDELQYLEGKYPDFKDKNSPISRIGSDISNDFSKVKHAIPVLSLDKVYSVENLSEWMMKILADYENSSFSCAEKYDGTSIVLYYREGILETAVSRGDGIYGNDITSNVKTIKSIPLHLKEKVTAAIRGEVFIEKDQFKKYNDKFNSLYANERNFAAGTLNRIKSKEVAQIPLKFAAYDMTIENHAMHNSNAAVKMKNDTELLIFLKESGFFISENTVFFGKPGSFISQFRIFDYAQIETTVKWFVKNRQTLTYQIDGLVIKVNELEIREKLGYTGHHPRWAVAYKFEAPSAVTSVENIVVQVGRGGRITPVAILKPVNIAGSTVTRATLHNEDYIRALDLAIHDTVSVSKRGDIIPAVEEVLEKTSNSSFIFPKKCPSCNSPLIKEGPIHFCKNENCLSVLSEKIRYFASRSCMNIENLGEETIDLLFTMGYIKDIADLYAFNLDILLDHEGFGEKKVALLKKGLEGSKKQPFETVLTSLGIKELGKQTARLLLKAGFSSIDDLISTAKNGNTEKFSAINGIGPKMAEIFIQEFSKPKFIELAEKLKKAGLHLSVMDDVSDTSKDTADTITNASGVEKIFQNTVWCITGSFENFKPREKAQKEIELRGGEVISLVTKKLTHLLRGEKPGSKLDEAVKNGAAIVSEQQFLEMLESSSRVILKTDRDNTSATNSDNWEENNKSNDKGNKDELHFPKNAKKKKNNDENKLF